MVQLRSIFPVFWLGALNSFFLYRSISSTVESSLLCTLFAIFFVRSTCCLPLFLARKVMYHLLEIARGEEYVKGMTSPLINAPLLLCSPFSNDGWCATPPSPLSISFLLVSDISLSKLEKENDGYWFWKMSKALFGTKTSLLAHCSLAKLFWSSQSIFRTWPDYFFWYHFFLPRLNFDWHHDFRLAYSSLLVQIWLI